MAEDNGNVFHRDDILYLAGFLDGEGCFTMSHNGVRGTVHGIFVEQTDCRVLEWCVAKFGGHVRQKPRRTASRADIFEWALRRRIPLVALLTPLVPHLKIKIIPATILLDYCIRFNRGCANRVPYTEEDTKAIAQYVSLMRIANATGRDAASKKEPLKLITSIEDVRVAAGKI